MPGSAEPSARSSPVTADDPDSAVRLAVEVPRTAELPGLPRRTARRWDGTP
ncbi:hypothetical protein [Streptomyces cucumeris]|uniref:hypothetical protein n=1 Tax=Streptomyces cucumeris TaxID=2962890 RepID=UPI003D738E16